MSLRFANYRCPLPLTSVDGAVVICRIRFAATHGPSGRKSGLAFICHRNEECAMTQLTIVNFGEAAAVVLPASVMETVGLRIGDVLEATLSERQLTLRPV